MDASDEITLILLKQQRKACLKAISAVILEPNAQCAAAFLLPKEPRHRHSIIEFVHSMTFC